jgi:hypothetical protein
MNDCERRNWLSSIPNRPQMVFSASSFVLCGGVIEEDRYLVYLVCLACLVKQDQPDEQNRPDEPDQPAPPASRATIVFPQPANLS